MAPSAAAVDFDDFYRATASRVIHVVYAMTGDLPLAQDCAQEAYARAWSQWQRIRAYDEPLAWVRTVARRLAISDWRRRERESASLARLRQRGVTASHAEATITAVTVTDALATLTREHREALALFYVCDLSVEQIARELDAPVGTVKARLHRGRAALASRLGTTYTAEEFQP